MIVIDANSAATAKTEMMRLIKRYLPFARNPRRGGPFRLRYESVPGLREAVHGPSGHFLWYFWPRLSIGGAGGAAGDDAGRHASHSPAGGPSAVSGNESCLCVRRSL